LLFFLKNSSPLQYRLKYTFLRQNRLKITILGKKPPKSRRVREKIITQILVSKSGKTPGVSYPHIAYGDWVARCLLCDAGWLITHHLLPHLSHRCVRLFIFGRSLGIKRLHSI